MSTTSNVNEVEEISADEISGNENRITDEDVEMMIWEFSLCQILDAVRDGEELSQEQIDFLSQIG